MMHTDGTGPVISAVFCVNVLCKPHTSKLIFPLLLGMQLCLVSNRVDVHPTRGHFSEPLYKQDHLGFWGFFAFFFFLKSDVQNKALFNINTYYSSYYIQDISGNIKQTFLSLLPLILDELNGNKGFDVVIQQIFGNY